MSAALDDTDARPPAAAAAPASAVETPPVSTRFRLGERLTDEQRAFFDTYGFLHFEGFISPDEVEGLRQDMATVQARWIAEGRTKVNGIPVRYGMDVDGKPMVQRFAFTSRFGENFHRLVNDPRFEPVKALIGEDCRVGEDEKDGVVVNHYVNVEGSTYKQLGWHTDGLRDLFYLRMPGPMLNVGLYLDDSPLAKGGLRILPGTHKQGFFRMAFGKLYFLDNRTDPREVCLEARAGDLTIHDGRLWHRVARALVEGEASRRRVMYVPFLNGPYQPKDESSPTPFYHRLQKLVG
ncbi:MAG: phytanoyl-CoA dioxygenase family protein [Deltaproteobacteria bacterium]|nr:phytanoyl-CoA dioxygenase family protein [Deltaproteobacteria bacterium]MCB9786827.1 phytanoyl-CoA dioxygenase family protein [Deltaproteobacteria bacterium]